MKWYEVETLRKRHGLSQAALAEKIGISQSALGNYERGTRAPDKDVIVALARFFYVSCDFLLGCPAHPAAPLWGPPAVAEFLHTLPPDERHAIADLAMRKPDALRKLLMAAVNLQKR